MINVTVPFAPGGKTAAVNVTDWPNVDGFAFEVIVVPAFLPPAVALAQMLGPCNVNIVKMMNKIPRNKIFFNIIQIITP
jgi:hypothetical protein